MPAPVSGRNYQVFVSLPAGYEANPGRNYPTLYVTDADYAFPIIRQIARRMNLEGPVVQEFIWPACPTPRATRAPKAAAATTLRPPTARAVQAPPCMAAARPIRPI